MERVELPEPITDGRGSIRDLIGKVDGVTRIRTKKGAIRGNHVHRQTRQWTYVVSGNLLVAWPGRTVVVIPGEMVVDEPGEPHAWKAITDVDCLVFTVGPRTGEDYESDTERLKEPLLT